MLSCPGNTNDGDEKQRAHDEVVECYDDAAYQNPKDVGEHGPTAAGRRIGYYFFTKGPQDQSGQFKTLQSKRDSNNGEAEHQTAHNISYSGEQSAENQPDEIS